MTPYLFHESLSEALEEVVKALGGHKAIGALLKPEKAPEAAGRWLHDCLNPNRSERLEPDQVLFILREGRKYDSHAAMNYLLREAGYADAQPIEPEDEKARLQREFVAGIHVLTKLAAKLEKNA